MRHVRAIWIIAATVGLTSCGGGGDGSPPTGPGPAPPASGGGGNFTVVVSNNNYSPASLTATRGSTGTWQWDSCTDDGYGTRLCTPHSVTFDDGGSSATARESGTFQRQFASAGTYTYYCTAHGRTVMSGSVTVQ